MADQLKPARLTPEQKKRVQMLLDMPLTKGEARSVHMCQDKGCRNISAHDFVPYGLGQGKWWDPCFCQLDDINWIFRARQLAERKSVHELRAARKKPAAPAKGKSARKLSAARRS